MRLIDADAAAETAKRLGMEVPWSTRTVLLLLDLTPTVTQPSVEAIPNEPLTLEELREMDGEPVWCKSTKSYVFIACVKDEPYKQIWFFTNKGKWDTILFCLTKFYRRRPENQKDFGGET